MSKDWKYVTIFSISSSLREVDADMGTEGGTEALGRDRAIAHATITSRATSPLLPGVDSADLGSDSTEIRKLLYVRAFQEDDRR